MKLIFKLLISLILITSNFTYGQAIKKCDVTIVLFTRIDMGQLSQEELGNFLLTFGQVCRNNAEYSEFSNAVLFEALDKQTELVLKTMNEEKEIELNVILEDLGTPVNDLIDVKAILKKVEKVKVSGQVKDKVIGRLKSAIVDMN